jgi:hypothetical protein
MSVLMLSDEALVPKDPAPAPGGPHPVRPVWCPLCHQREEESHSCASLGHSEVLLAVSYADSSMTLVQT